MTISSLQIKTPGFGSASSPISYGPVQLSRQKKTNDEWISKWTGGSSDACVAMDASEEFADLRRQIAELKSEILGLHKPVQIRKATEGAIRNHVSQVLCRLNSGDEIFPSDVAFEFGLDVEDVMCVMDKMREEGLLK